MSSGLSDSTDQTGGAAAQADTAPQELSWKSLVEISVAYQVFLVALIISGSFLYGRPGDFRGHLEAMLRNWDAQHYLRIAEHGYAREGPTQPLIVFFPFYPLLIAALAPLAGFLKAAFAITTLASVAGHALFFHYLRLIGYDQRRLFRLMTLVFLSPISIYFTAVYTEAVYFLLTVLFLFLLKREKYFLAAVCGFCAALTRNMGVLFAIPYLFAVWGSGPRPVVIRRASYVAVIGCGTAIYLGINAWIFGDPFAFTGFMQRNWYKTSVNPITRYWDAFRALVMDGGSMRGAYDLLHIDRLATLLFPALFVAYAWKIKVSRSAGGASEGRPDLPPGLLLWSVAQFLVVCSQSFWVSNLRYLALVIPAYLMIERVFDRSWSFAIWILVSTGIAVFAVRQYLHLYWVF